MRDLTLRILSIGNIPITGATGFTGTTTEIAVPLSYIIGCNTLQEGMIKFKDLSDLDLAQMICGLQSNIIMKEVSDFYEDILAQRQLDYYKNL